MEYLDYIDMFDNIKFRVLTGELTYEKAEKEIDILSNAFTRIYVNESSDIKDKIIEKVDLVKKLGLTKHEPKVLELSNIKDDTFYKIKSLIDKMKTDTVYPLYKKRFDDLTRLLGINPSVIITYKLKKGDEKDKNYAYIRYEEKNKKFNVPKGYALYHISPAHNIEALKPVFRGKAPRCYFYSTPRVYVSLNKNMSKGFAQFKGAQKDVDVTKYMVTGSYGDVYIDDRIGNIFSGALYIEGNKPIKVSKVSDVSEATLDSVFNSISNENTITEGKMTDDIKRMQDESKYKKELKDSLSKFHDMEKEYKEKISKADSEWRYKDAIKMTDDLKKEIHDCLDKASKISDKDKKEETESLLNKKISEYDKQIKDFKIKDVKKKANQFNNKYWIDYTKKHNQAFRDVEKEMRGFNTKRGIEHDMDKYMMYHFLPPPLAHKIHTLLSTHHKNRAKTKEDYTQMLIDWESNRRTKPDKQLKPYQIIDKFYPDLKSELIPIMKEYGIPTNEAEDKKLEKSGKKYLPNKHNNVDKE